MTALSNTTFVCSAAFMSNGTCLLDTNDDCCVPSNYHKSCCAIAKSNEICGFDLILSTDSFIGLVLFFGIEVYIIGTIGKRLRRFLTRESLSTRDKLKSFWAIISLYIVSMITSTAYYIIWIGLAVGIASMIPVLILDYCYQNEKCVTKTKCLGSHRNWDICCNLSCGCMLFADKITQKYKRRNEEKDEVYWSNDLWLYVSLFAITIFDTVYPFFMSIFVDLFIWIYGKMQYLSNQQNMKNDKQMKQ